jgi:hypothetical protein
VVLGALLAPLTLFIPYAGTPEPAMEAWRPRAGKAWPLIAAANAFLSMGVLTGFAAPLIPWFKGYAGAYTGATGVTLAYCAYSYDCGALSVNVYLLGGSIAIFFGLLFCLVAWGLGLIAGARLRGVAAHGASSKRGGCCAPSMPAIQALVWTGFWFCCSGAAANWSLLGILYSTYNSTSPGGSLLAFSIASLFVSATLFSATGCCVLGPLPGVGTSTANCCCVERDHSRQPPDVNGSAPHLAPGAARYPQAPHANIYDPSALGIYGGGAGAMPAGALAPAAPPFAQQQQQQQQQQRADGGAQWRAPCACYPYAFFCTACAASDVAEHLQPNTWWSYCCCLLLQSYIPCAGFVMNICKLLDTRRQLAQRDGVADDVEFLGMCCCASCRIGQELAHIQAASGAATGAAKPAPPYAYSSAHPPAAYPPTTYPPTAYPPAAYAPAAPAAGLHLSSPPAAATLALEPVSAAPTLEAQVARLSASHAKAVAALEEKHQVEVGALVTVCVDFGPPPP